MAFGLKKKPPKTAQKALREDGSGTGNPYMDAQNVWMERYGTYVQQAYNWRLLAMLEAIALIIAVVGLLYIAGQTKFVPYVVAVDKIGQAFAVHPADRASPLDPNVVKAQLANWIVQSRSVVTDRVVEHAYTDAVYAIIPESTAAKGYLDSYYQAAGGVNDPFVRGGHESVEVSVTALLPVSPNTWTAQWDETIRNLQGKQTGHHTWEASISIGFVPPKDEGVIMKNPLGLYITNLNWTQKL